MDNETMFEAFKYLNYCQLAKNSLVSNRFRNLIQTHRHKLALFYVDAIVMHTSPADPAVVNIFDKELTSEAYNEWAIRNNYSKQAPIGNQIASAENTQNVPRGYRLCARAHYDDLNYSEWDDETIVFQAHVEVNHESWPVFQHFVRLATDPFIYIDFMDLTPQNDVLNLLSGALNSDHDRLQCKILHLNLNANRQYSITWAKNYVRCNHFTIYGGADFNQNEAFLDFVVTAGHCTQSIKIGYRDLSKAVNKFVQKFTKLKNADECQFVEAIEGNFKFEAAKLMNRYFAKFLVKEEINDDGSITEQVLEFHNNNIGKKLQLTVINYYNTPDRFSIKINNL